MFLPLWMMDFHESLEFSWVSEGMLIPHWFFQYFEAPLEWFCPLSFHQFSEKWLCWRFNNSYKRQYMHLEIMLTSVMVCYACGYCLMEYSCSLCKCMLLSYVSLLAPRKMWCFSPTSNNVTTPFTTNTNREILSNTIFNQSNE